MATAVLSAPLTGNSASSYPQVSPQVRAMLAQERMELLRNPAKMKPPADLTLQDRFIFRTQPGAEVPQFYHQLDVPPMYEPEDHSEKGMRRKFFWLSWVKRHQPQFDPEKKKTREQIATEAAAYYEHLVDVIGDKSIVFRRVRGAKECYWSTNDKEAAAYVRGLMQRKVGDFAHVYETSGFERIVVGYKTEHERAFPSSELGRQMAFAYANEHGLDDLKVVRE